MTPERFQQICAVFDRVVESPPELRKSCIENLCGEDTELAKEVERMVEAAAYSTCAIDHPAVELARETAGTGSPARPWQPVRIGRYRMVGVLGEGGMGVVYEAEQDQPHRTVALKVIRPGFAGPGLLRRFELEAEALGRLQHPGIAQIYEAGTADTGFGLQPYFAMELIRGEPLLEYAEKRHLNTRQKLELMAKVCEAVHHAHQRGIIHRDLKPGNILVEESGQPKVLDFGVARVTDSDAQATRQTEAGQIVGTLAYMSPEQVLGDPLELDTRTDVYSLGVILFELMAGRLPYKVGGQLHEAILTIREGDATRLSSISGTYRGDIETIVRKALEKDKARRYASAAGMAGDIRRYLNDEPIIARPPSTIYQLRKLARRHKALVGGLMAVFVVLVAGIIVSTREARRALRAEHAAITEAATAKAVNDFLQNDLLAQASPSSQARPDAKPDPDLKVRTALDRAAARIGGKFDTQPLVEASIRQTIGTAYMDLGLYQEARRHIERALELRKRVLKVDHAETLGTMHMLAELYHQQGKYAQAEPLYTKTLEIQRRVLGEKHRDTLATENALADLYDHEGKYRQAEALFTTVLEVQRRLLGEEHASTLDTMHNLAGLYQQEGRYAQAEPLYTKVLQVRQRVQGQEHPDTLRAMSGLALVYLGESKYAQAEPLLIKVLQVRRRVLGEEHPSTLFAMDNLAHLYFNQGKYAQGEPLCTRVVEIERRVLGEDHRDTLTSMNNLAVLYRTQGQYMQAERLSAKTLQVEQRTLGEAHLLTLTTMSNLAAVYLNEGKYLQAERLYGKVLEVRRRVLGNERADTLSAMSGLALAYSCEEKYTESEVLFIKALEAQRRVVGEEHASTLETMHNLASLYQKQHRYAQAEPLYTRVLPVQRRVLGNEHPATLSTVNDLALLYVNQGRHAHAEPLLKQALSDYQEALPNDWRRYHCQSLLGASLAGQKKYAEAESLLVSGYEGMAQREPTIPAPSRFKLAESGQWIIRLYQQWGKPDKVAQWRHKLQGRALLLVEQ